MAAVSRLCVSLVVLAAMSGAVPSPAAAAAARHVSADGAVYTFGSGPSGEMVLSVDSGDLHVEKSVAPDGSSALTLRAGADDLRLELTQGRVAVSGRDGEASFIPDGTDENGEAAVRVALARSRAAHLFRALAARVEEGEPKSAYERAVRLSGAVVAQLAGQPGALRAFARRQQKTSGVRPVALGFTDCWGEYERAINWAYDRYLYCLADAGGKLYIHSLSWCEIQYTMRAESAWFQFLSCSAFPLV